MDPSQSNRTLVSSFHLSELRGVNGPRPPAPPVTATSQVVCPENRQGSGTYPTNSAYSLIANLDLYVLFPRAMLASARPKQIKQQDVFSALADHHVAVCVGCCFAGQSSGGSGAGPASEREPQKHQPQKQQNSIKYETLRRSG